MTEDNTIKIYQSIINSNYTVHIVYKENPRYKDIKESLDLIKSVGALQIGTTNIYIDGESIIDQDIDQDQILALEAHEIAHSVLQHAPGMDEQAEKEADLFAITLLDMDRHYRASEYLKQRLQTNYGIDYSEFEMEFENEFEDDWKVIDTEMFGDIIDEHIEE